LSGELPAEDRLIALSSAPPVFAVVEAERIVADLYGLTASAEALAGERDGNFHVRTRQGQDFVLKILGGDRTEGPECQVRVLRHLEIQDPTLPVPRVFTTLQGTDLGLVTQEGNSYSTCLIAYMPGRMLADMAPSLALLRDVGATLARVDRALRGFFHPALARRIAWDVRELPALTRHLPCIGNRDLRRLVATVAADFGERLRAVAALRAQALHGDGHGGNVAVQATGDRVAGILDFGDMIHGPLALELAVAMAEAPTRGLEPAVALSAVLAGYMQVQSLEADEIELLYDLIMARHAVTLAIHAWRLQHDAGAAILHEAALHAEASLDWMQSRGRASLTQHWHGIAGTRAEAPLPVTLERRHRLLGANAELFYEQPLHFVRGSGVYLFDPEDRAYLDVYNNVPHVGHCHPAVVRAIAGQAARLATHSRYLHGAILEYAEALTARCPPQLNTCIFVNSGSEANDVAWRLAQFATGRRGAVIMADAYHGITNAVAALTPASGDRGESLEPWVVALDPPTAQDYEETMSEADIAAVTAAAGCAVSTLDARGLGAAAFFLDTGLTSSGIYDAPPSWAKALSTELRSAGCLLVADEVQYGLGRSGSHFWGFERRGLMPDIVTLGKPIGNGYPMGAVIANRALVEAFQAKFGFFSTFGGNAVAARAGLAVLDVIDREALLANAGSTGKYFRERLQAVASEHAGFGRVRGTGLLLGLEVRGADAAAAKSRTKQIINVVKNRSRILIGYEGPNGSILKLRPPLPFQPAHADLVAAAIGEAAALIGD